MDYTFSITEEDMRFIGAMGIDEGEILEKANIPYDAIQSGEYTITEQQYIDIYWAIDSQIDCGEVLPFSDVRNRTVFIPAVFAGLAAGNGLNCLRRVHKYKKLAGPFLLELEEGVHETTISFHFRNGEAMPPFAVVNEQATIISMIRKGTGKETICPIRVETPFEVPDNVVDMYGVRPLRSDENRVVFNNMDLGLPFVTENNNMWAYLEASLNEKIEALNEAITFSSNVQKVLCEIIPSGISDVESVSKELGVSKRTLQRKLKDEDTNFAEQLNVTREMLVRNYLRTDMTLDEIAFLVNYSDAKSLSRAFRVWTGRSVSDYRKELKSP